MCRPWILCTCRLNRTCCHTFHATKVLRPRTLSLLVSCASNALVISTPSKYNFSPFFLLLLLFGVTFSALCGSVCFQVLYCSRFAVYVTCAQLWYSTDSHGKCEIFPNNSTTNQKFRSRSKYIEFRKQDSLILATLYECCGWCHSIGDVARVLLAAKYLIWKILQSPPPHPDTKIIHFGKHKTQFLEQLWWVFFGCRRLVAYALFV